MIKPLTSYDRIIWDFNGTILDDVWHGIRCVNCLLKKRGLKEITDLEYYYEVFGFPIEDYYRRLGLLEHEDYQVVAHEWIEEYRRGEKHIPARPSAVKLLSAIHQKGVPQSVLSATELSMLHEQLTYLGILPLFDFVLGRGDIYAADKTSIAKAFRDTHPHENILMIGDTDHDYHTAKAADFECVLVAGGHQSLTYLKTLGCDTMPDFETLGGALLGTALDS